MKLGQTLIEDAIGYFDHTANSINCMILLPALVSALPIADAALAVDRDEPEVEDSAKRPRRVQDSGRFVDLQVGSDFGIFVD